MTAVETFVEELGLISQENGGTRIAGRIVGLLLSEGGKLSLAQISERLGVSRASVSTNARLLTRRGALRLTTHAGSRQDYYELSGLPFFDVLEDLAGQFTRHGQTIARCVDGMRSEDPQAAARAEELNRFFDQSAAFLKNWSDTLRSEASTRKDEQ